MDLSIIIPVYNTPPESLQRCFDSIRLPADFTYEVLIMDDGSGDDVGTFCRKYADAHSNYQYIRQESRGVSAARNRGISCASGRYIMFLDADDELLSDAILHTYVEADWDIVFFDYYLCREGKVHYWKLLNLEAEVPLSRKELFFASCCNQVNTVWAKLFKRTLLLDTEIRFDETMIVAEDARFVLSAILQAENLYYVAKPVYRYAYSNANGNKRLARFPHKVVANTLSYYNHKKETLDTLSSSFSLTTAEMDQLHIAINAQVVNDVFEAIGSLSLMGMTFQDILEASAELMETVHKTSGHSFGIKTNIKCFLLRHKWMPVIWLCAHMRLLYIKIC